MSKHLIENFPSKKGEHCASTALSELSTFYGWNISEAMAFGIGSGPSFVYLTYYPIDYSRIIFGRSPILENDFFKSIHHDFKWNHGENLDWEMVKHYIDHNIPILMLTDTYYLDFYEINAHNFAGHTLVLIGYDEESNTAYVSDNIKDSIITTSLDLLIKSMSKAKAPFFKKYVWSPVLPFSKPNSVKDVIIHSILNTSQKMLNSPSSSMGLRAIKRLEHEIVFWPDLPNWQECCINVYRSLEFIGTGGAGFRNLYTVFIEEAAFFLPFLKEINSLNKMKEIAATYNKLSKKFYLAGRKGEMKYLVDIQELLSNLYNLEFSFWSEIRKIVLNTTIPI
jgi:hypothetical protein